MKRSLYGLSALLLLISLASCDVFTAGIDDRAPNAEIVRPGNSAVVGGLLRIYVRGQAFGPETNNISFVTIHLDGEPVGTAYVYAREPDLLFAYDLDTSMYPDGEHVLEAVVQDLQGAQGLSVPVTVVFKNHSPEPGVATDILSPENGARVSGVVRIAVQPRPGEPTPVAVDFMVDGVALEQDTEAPFFMDWDTQQEFQGPHVLQVRAYRTSEAFSFSPAIEVTVEASPGEGEPTSTEPGKPRFVITSLGSEIRGAVAVGFGGEVYVGAQNDTLYAFTKDGHLRWKRGTGGPISAAPVIGNDENIYVVSEDGRLYGFSPSGAQLWTPYTTGSRILSTPAIDVDGTLYFGDVDGNVHAVSSFDGHLRTGWPVKVARSAIQAPPVIARDRTIIVASADGYVYALDPEGNLKWRSVKNYGTILLPMALMEMEIPVPGAPKDSTVMATVVYTVSSYNQYVFAVSGIEGRILWEYQSTSRITSGPVVGPEGNVYVGTQTGLMALSSDVPAEGLPAELRLKWIYNTPEVQMPAVDVDGTLYAVSQRTLFARNPNNTPQWSYELSAPSLTPATMDYRGNVYVATVNGVVYAFNTSAAGPARVNWPMFQINARHVGRIGPDAYDQ